MSRVVVALGGNALLRRGQSLTDENQQHNVAEACEHLARVATDHELVVSHGNGPQVGLLALQGAAYEKVPTYPLDVLGAQTQGMIGYLVARELDNRTAKDTPVAALLTMIEVDPNDPAFTEPTKPIGPFYDAAEADQLAADRGWEFRPDGDAYRRVVPSPKPKRVVELTHIKALLGDGAVVICAGGGGVPTMTGPDGLARGIEAVIDKDFATELLAEGIDADRFLMATDIDSVYVNWRQPEQASIARAHPDAIEAIADTFPAGSMRPKVLAAAVFARSTEHPAMIGSLGQITEILAGNAGTTITVEADEIEYRA